MRTKVVVIGHGYTSRLGLIRSLAEIDCDITVIVMVFFNRFGRFVRFDWGKPIDCYSKYVDRFFYCRAGNPENLIDLLISKCKDSNQKVILIPDSDYSALAIDNYQDRLKKYFLFPHINHTAGSISHWMQKTSQKQLAQELNLNVTNGCVITLKDGMFNIPDKVSYPCFTKPLMTVGGGKEYLRRCDNKEELYALLASIKKNINVLVEDYKPIETEYAVVGFSDEQNVIIPGVIEFIKNSKSHFGIAREGKIMPIDGFEPLLEQFKLFVKRIGFCGLFDVDFFQSGEKLYFCEMNLRFGGSGYAYTRMGVNLPAMFVKALIGESYSDLNQLVEKTSTYVNERMCIDDWCDSYIDKREMLSIIDSGDIRFIFDKDDPKPGNALKRYVFLQGINRRVRLLINRIH